MVPWSVIHIFNCPSDKVSAFDMLFTEVLDLHTPMKTFRIKKNPAPWITKSIRDGMDRCNALFRLYRKNQLTVSWKAFKVQQNHITSIQGKANQEYFHHLLKKNAHSSTLWTTLKRRVRFYKRIPNEHGIPNSRVNRPVLPEYRRGGGYSS